MRPERVATEQHRAGAGGAYTLERIIKPHFAHSPEVVVDPTDGARLVYRVGAGLNNTEPCPVPNASTCRWTNCSGGCTGPEHPWLSGLSFYAGLRAAVDGRGLELERLGDRRVQGQCWLRA